MANAIQFINSFTSDLENIQDKYTTSFINPYTRAYITAHTEFRKVLKAQGDANKAAMKLALTAFSIAGGGLLIIVFAKSALKSVALDITLNVITNNNMERSFRAAALIEGSETASFIVGKLWESGQSLLSQKFKKSLEANATAFPSLEKFHTSPLTINTYLQDFVLNAKTKAHDAAAEIRDNPKLSDDQKINSVKQIKASRFCNPAPLAINEVQLAKNIELSWWMTHLLGLDYVATTKTIAGFRFSTTNVTRQPITANPSSAAYPKPNLRPATENEMIAARSPLGPRPVARRTVHGTGWGRHTETVSETIVYDSPGGSEIRTRIDALYRAKKGRDFFDGTGVLRHYSGRSVHKGELVKAEMMVRELGNSAVSQLARKATQGG